MRQSKSWAVALTGMLFALAVVLGWLESLLAPLLGLAPGLKLGLANVVVMYALLYLSGRQALLLAALKALFVFLTRGAVAGALSASGGLVSLAVMWLLLRAKNRPSWFILSASGAVTHNLGQLAAAAAILGSALALNYAPVLLVAGLAMGWLTSLSLKALIPALERLGFSDKKR